MRLISLVIAMLIFQPAIALGDPSVTGVGSSATHGASLTITGSGFGSKSPAAPLWWDNMEGHTTNTHSSAVFGTGDLTGVVSSLPSGSRHYSAALPTSNQPTGYAVPEAYMMVRASGWDSALLTTGNGVDAPHSHSTKYAAGCHYEFAETPYTIGDPTYRDDAENQVHYDNVGFTVSVDGGAYNILVAYWYYRIDPAWIYDDGHPDNIYFNHKAINPETSYQAYNTGMYTVPFNYRSFDHAPEEYGTGATVAWEDQSMACSSTTQVDGTNPRFAWLHVNHLWDNTNNVEQIYEGGVLKTGGTGCTDAVTVAGYTFGGFWGACNQTANGSCSSINTLWFGCRDCYRYFDDLYLDNTYSRVELCNSATHSSATICEPQPPTAWATGEISVTVNLGALTDSTVYAFVFDSNNVANSPGYSVTVGASGAGNISNITIGPGGSFY